MFARSMSNFHPRRERSSSYQRAPTSEYQSIFATPRMVTRKSPVSGSVEVAIVVGDTKS